jgi:hypothetical protein
MTEGPQESAKNRIAEQLTAALDQLSADQIRFVVARQYVNSDVEAAGNVEIPASTVYHWPKIVGETVKLMAADGVVVARYILRKNVAKAAQVKAAGLSSKNEKTQQDAATDILDRAGLKEPVKVDVTSKGEQIGGPESVGEAIAILDAARAAEADTGGGTD